MKMFKILITGAAVLVLEFCHGAKTKHSRYGTSAKHLVETTKHVLKLLPENWPGTNYWNTTCQVLFPENMSKIQKYSVSLRVSRRYVRLLLDVYNDSQHMATKLFTSCAFNEQVWDTINKTDENLNAISKSGNDEVDDSNIKLTKDTVKTLNASNVFEMMQSFGECIKKKDSVDKCAGIVIKECADTKRGEHVEKVKKEERKNKRVKGRRGNRGGRGRKGRKQRRGASRTEREDPGKRHMLVQLPHFTQQRRSTR